MTVRYIAGGVVALCLGLVFLVSALPKVRHPRGLLLTVMEYRVLPPAIEQPFAAVLPAAELGVALLLFTGVAVRLAAIVLILLLLSFIWAIGVNMARGRDFDCQCFGAGIHRQIGARLLLEDIALLVGASALLSLASTWLAVEPWSFFRLIPLQAFGFAKGGTALGILFALAVCLVLAVGIVLLLRLPWRQSVARLATSDLPWRKAGAGTTN